MADKVSSIVGALANAQDAVLDVRRKAATIGSQSLSTASEALRQSLSEAASRLSILDPDLAVPDLVVEAVGFHLDRMTEALRADDLGGVIDHGLALVGSLPGDPQTDP